VSDPHHSSDSQEPADSNDPGPGSPEAHPATQKPPAQPAWHSFGVPHGGAPEPPAYTPAMRERPRADLTQPIDTTTTQAVPPAGETDRPAPSETSRGWWSTPGTLGGSSGNDGTDGTHGADGTDGPRSAPVSPPAVVAREPWGLTPVGDGATPPYAPQQGSPYSAPSWAPGTPSGGPAGPHGPYGPYAPALGGATTVIPVQPGPGGPSRHRSVGRRRWAGLAALAVVAALLGGGVALAGQQLLTRGTTLGSAVPAPGPGSTARPDGSIAKIAADALPSVVTIRIKSSQGSGTGSGFVIDKQGHILTNNHVVAAAGSGGDIQAELNNGTMLPAKVVGADTSYDLAVIKVEATDLAPLQFGASKDVVVGDGVIAVGAPLGLDATVTSGIVSALNRPVTPGGGNDQSFINAIQTDAAINPGNSGGPLLDMNGRVIGINSAIARIPGSSTDSSGGNIGVGFAIPSDQASKTAQQLITTGKADHPALGVSVDRSYTGDGAKIAAGGVKAGSAAEQAGLKEGDIVTEFEGKKVTDADALIVAIRARSVGDTVSMKIQRGNQTVTVSVPLQSASS